MTAETSTTTRLLPVSILAGPCGRALVQEIAVSHHQRELGLLISPDSSSPASLGQLTVEPLASYDPQQIRAQISAMAENGSIDHLIIECSANTHPIAFASLFLPDGDHGNAFSQTARLSSILFAIDSETLLNAIVNGNPTPGVASTCILADQIECADGIILTGDPAETERTRAEAVVTALNPAARIIRPSSQMVPSGLVDNDRSFDFETAFAGAGWRRLMAEEPVTRRNDQGVTTFMYRARRPFHPEKFWNAIQDPFPGVFRAKGFFWLATRMETVGGLNVAGSECFYSPAGQWWAAQARDHDHAEIPDRLKKEWAEPFGDRRQAIAFMGIDLDPASVTQRLDDCLLTESEMNSGEQSWASLPDPFPAWTPAKHEHECDDHDCCHH